MCGVYASIVEGQVEVYRIICEYVLKPCPKDGIQSAWLVRILTLSHKGTVAGVDRLSFGTGVTN